ncbi:hypothetical protein CsatB_018255 [Cannabis sativa]
MANPDEEEEESVVCNDIAFDLLENILSRLDAKSVKKCECVCKSWLSLLRTQYFMNLHLNRQQLPRSDKGIIGISDHRVNIFCPLYYLWNPTTNESKKLPPLDFIEDKSYRLRGLGYDPLTNDFKVVVFTSQLKEGHKIGIYSSRSNSWKAITMPNLFPEFESVIVTPFMSMSINVNNFIHWSICYKNGNTSDDKDLEFSTGIVAFDISKEKFNLIKLPQVKKGNDGVDIAKIFGCLSMIYVDEDTVFHVWVMKNYGDSNSWYKYLSFSLNELIPTRFSKFCRISFLSDEIMLVNLFLTGYFCWYDSKSKMIEILGERYPVFRFTTYAESIFRLNES